MIPLAIDPSRLRLGLAARGPSGLRRLALLRSGGATGIAVFCDTADACLSRTEPGLIGRLPGPDDMAALDVLWVAGLPRAEAAALAALARAHRVPVNVEDAPALCDFHNVAELRRGDLLITVSTGGRNPGLAAAVRKTLEGQFGPEWAERLRAAADRRAGWRDAGHDMACVAALTERHARAEGWLG